MKTITINSKKHGTHIIMLDDEDFDKINRHKWRVNKNGRYLRPVTNILPRQGVKLHHLILPKKEGFIMDHIDRNAFNNQKSNIRYATKSMNGANRVMNRNNTTGYKGVVFFKRDGRFSAQIKVSFKHKFLGYFDSAEQAAIAYNYAAIKYFGESAKLNNI